jgi:hypothetical protein
MGACLGACLTSPGGLCWLILRTRHRSLYTGVRNVVVSSVGWHRHLGDVERGEGWSNEGSRFGGGTIDLLQACGRRTGFGLLGRLRFGGRSGW